MTLALIKTIHDASLKDVSAMLRKCADRIDAGEYGEGISAVCVLDGEAGIHVFGWGETDPRGALALLELGKWELLK